MPRTLVLTLLVSVMAGAVVGVRGPSASAQPGGPAWAPLMVPSPPGRSDGAMAANPAGGVVLFGGSIHPATGLVALGDTWTFYGEAWVEQHPPFGPPPRAQAAMAFDSARGVAVLFGGNTFTSRLGDTWTWDGTDWALEHPSTAPLA